MPLEQCLTQEVELIADQVPTINNLVPAGFKITFFDMNIGILPLHIFVTAACCLLVLAAVFYWFSRMRAMSDVQNYRTANGSNILQGNSILGFRLSNDLRLKISSMQFSAGCVAFGTDEPNNRSIWLHGSKNATAVLGNKPSVFLSDAYAVSRDLSLESALVRIIADYNSKCQNPKDRILNFVDWQNGGRRIMEAIYPNGIPAATYRQLNPTDIDRILPKNLTAAFFGSLIWQSAAELASTDNEDNGFFARYGGLLAIGSIVIIALVGAFFFPL